MNIIKGGQFVFLVVVLISCFGFSLLKAGQEGANAGTPVPITPLREQCDSCGPRHSFEVYTGITDRQRIVIRDREAWRDVWKRIYSLMSPTPPLPEVDFSKEMLVVVSLGGRGTGGYAIIIDGACERDDKLEVTVRSVSPGKNCMTTQALTAPVDIVRVPKTQRSVVFRENEIVHDCK